MYILRYLRRKFNPRLIISQIFQATKKLIKLADFEDDDLEMMDDSDDAASDDASDFDEDLDPDKIEVPGEKIEFS